MQRVLTLTYLSRMPASTEPLKEDVRNPVTAQARVAIVQDLWPERGTLSSEKHQLVWDAYFEVYTRECNAVLPERRSTRSVIGHGDLLEFIHLLERTDEIQEKKNAFRKKLRSSKIAQTMTTLSSVRHCPTLQETIDDLIVLSARLLTMTLVGQATASEKVRPKNILPWDTGSLQNAVHSHFNKSPDIPLETKDDIIGVGLTFYNIERVSGIKMIPTDNLLDHLLLVDEDRKLCVFHHASFLKRMVATQKYVT